MQFYESNVLFRLSNWVTRESLEIALERQAENKEEEARLNMAWAPNIPFTGTYNN